MSGDRTVRQLRADAEAAFRSLADVALELGIPVQSLFDELVRRAIAGDLMADAPQIH